LRAPKKASKKKREQRAARSVKRGRERRKLSARLVGHVTIEARSDGSLSACFEGASVPLGQFSRAAAARAQHLRTGLLLGSLASARSGIEKEMHRLVRRLARHGLLEYRFAHPHDGDDERIVIEPQVPDYWPRTPPLRDADMLALSRFAYMRRRGNDMVLESPRASALFRICDPVVASALAVLSTPRQLKHLRRWAGFPDIELLALLVDCRILFKVDPARAGGLRPDEGDADLVLWDFHDLLFHARCTEGRHANPLGGVYPHAGAISPLPGVRPRWPGAAIDLHKSSTRTSEDVSPTEKLLRARHSTRVFDDGRPITLAELSRFLAGTARVLSLGQSSLDLGEDSPAVEYAPRPYPSGGGSWELELYLAVDRCEGLARGFYHYDAGEHALVAIGAGAQELDALLGGAQFAMDAPAAPQILITIAARFGRVSWKYSSLAYSLILKDVGVLLQTFYLMATEMGLGGCAIGTVNIDLFAKLTGLEFHVEGPVGQFALGRPMEQESSDGN
jgi:SagB-type dehydrogenase family enzyme